jgi:hypothetical protein
MERRFAASYDRPSQLNASVRQRHGLRGGVVNQYALERPVWTHADFEAMGWHDATIHAIAFLPATFELALDIDYILQWIDPMPSEEYYSFWVAPATLIFENTFETQIKLEPMDEVTMQALERRDEQPTRPGFDGPSTAWQWVVDCNEGATTLRATGFRQIFRREPILISRQTLLPDERGEISFAQTPFRAPAVLTFVAADKAAIVCSLRSHLLRALQLNLGVR